MKLFSSMFAVLALVGVTAMPVAASAQEAGAADMPKKASHAHHVHKASAHRSHHASHHHKPAAKQG